MKKYVTPVMECDRFVTNEYVAVCYTLISWAGSPPTTIKLERGDWTLGNCDDDDNFYYYMDDSKEHWVYTPAEKIEGWDFIHEIAGLDNEDHRCTRPNQKHLGYDLKYEPVRSNAS